MSTALGHHRPSVTGVTLATGDARSVMTLLGGMAGADPEKNSTGFQPLLYRIYMVIFRLFFYLRTFRKVYNFQYTFFSFVFRPNR